eukprot:jgi/Chlat1/7684/Chrsp64S07149
MATTMASTSTSSAAVSMTEASMYGQSSRAGHRRQRTRPPCGRKLVDRCTEQSRSSVRVVTAKATDQAGWQQQEGAPALPLDTPSTADHARSNNGALEALIAAPPTAPRGDKPPPILPHSVEDYMLEACEAALRLGSFRKLVRVDVPFPVVTGASPSAVKRAVRNLADLFVAALRARYTDPTHFYVSMPETGSRADGALFSWQREIEEVRSMRPRVVVVVCPLADEATFVQNLAKAAGPSTPFIVFNPLWSQSEFGAGKEQESQFAAQFEKEAAVAYWMEEVLVPRTRWCCMLGTGVQAAVVKAYGTAGWNVFMLGAHGCEGYSWVRRASKRPTVEQLQEMANACLPPPRASLAQLGQSILKPSAPSCPLGWRYDEATNSCVPM